MDVREADERKTNCSRRVASNEIKSEEQVRRGFSGDEVTAGEQWLRRQEGTSRAAGRTPSGQEVTRRDAEKCKASTDNETE